MKQFKNKISSTDLSLFSRKLATLVSAGISLTQALHVIAQGYPKGALCSLVLKIKKELERGQAFAITLRNYPAHFNEFYCSLIEIGELSGSLDSILLRLANNQEKNEALKRKLKMALIYPLLIFVVATSIASFLLISIVPTFKDMFQNFQLGLPLATKTLLTLSDILRNHGDLLLTFLIITFFLCRKFYHTNKKLQFFIQRRSLQLPLFGTLLIKKHIASLTRVLAITETTGVPLNIALNTLASITTHTVFIQTINHIRLQVERGQRLGTAIEANPFFPIMVKQMISIGEESGTLGNILEKLSTILDDELETSIAQLTTLVEPCMMLCLGLMIGGLVIALYLPIFNMGSLF